MSSLVSSNNEKAYSPTGTEILAILKSFEKSNFVTYIQSPNSDSQNIAQSLKFFDPDVAVITLTDWDTIPYDRVSPSVIAQLKRISALYTLASLNSKKTLLITSLPSISQYVLPKELVLQYSLKLTKLQSIDRDQLLKTLTEIGYIRSTTANTEGEFAVRGGIIDIVATTNNQGYRLNLFGNNIDQIKCFDTETQMSSNEVSECIILPVSEAILNHNTINHFKENYRKLFGITNDPLIEAVSNGARYAGLENWLPLLYPKLDTIFDYIPDNAYIILHEELFSQIEENNTSIEQFYSTRIKLSNDTYYQPIKPSNLYLTPDQIISKITTYFSLTLSPFKKDDQPSLFIPTKNLHLESKTSNLSVFELLQNYISNLKQETINQKGPQKKFIIACFTQGSLDRLRNMITDHGFHCVNIESWSARNILSGKTLGLSVLPIEHGFIYENYVILSEQDILGVRLSRTYKRRKHAAKFLQEIGNFTEGEYIVHIDHGIGKFAGIETLKIENVIHDFIKIIYIDDDKLYLPVENLELLTKYGGDDLTIELDKLGSSGWQIKKHKLQNKLKIAAETLLKIAAQRELEQGILMDPIKEMYEKFCQKFPYVETNDQLNAISDVEQNLSSGKTMDRLVCGDVGFGKTEIALRAACIAVASPTPYQVAIIVPTTLLSRQHYKNFSERFDGLPVKVAQLSRFVSNSESKKIKIDVSEGRVDIVIGTHTLLANDIKFKNLGLIIIDEEQHFGVAQKEKLKKLKSNTHILTLSATPIPRTLQMSLTGIKDLSLIATPPIDRLPIKTYVMPYDAFIIREAILREHARGGRTFYVSPRISYLDEIEQRLKEITPEIKIVKAHGKLTASKLDQIMNDFYDGKFDVLLSTSIVESGLDIPFANTIIVDRADMFGLAQLYQIRGRVGRSNAKSFAYLLTNQGAKLNPVAQKRLEIIQSLETLGTGFTIASHDLDIRGYGNLVGDEQSGHIKDVGIELYQEMLAEAIENIKLHNDISIDSTPWSPTINIGISVQIPESYISDSSLRLSIYRKIAQISELNELESFAAELIDRFGTLPTDAEHLFEVIKLKQLAKNLNIAKIDCGEKAVLISFRNNKPINPDKILSFIKTNSAKLKQDGKLLINKEFKDEASKIRGIEKILAHLQ